MESNLQTQATSKAKDSQGGRVKKKKGKRIAEKPPKVSKWHISSQERIIWIIPAVAIVALVLLAVQISRYFTDYTLEQDAYQYYGGGEFCYEEGTLFRHQDDATMVTMNGFTTKMASLPLYLEDGGLFLPTDMLYWDIGKTYQSRLEYYTEVSLDKYEQVVFTREEDTSTQTGGFMYDGADLYVFLEPVVLKFNSYAISLPAFSYVEVSATTDLMLYDRHWDEFYTETPRTDVIVVSESGDYTISLINDTVQQTNGTLQLLASKPSKLDCLM